MGKICIWGDRGAPHVALRGNAWDGKSPLAARRKSCGPPPAAAPSAHAVSSACACAGARAQLRVRGCAARTERPCVLGRCALLVAVGCTVAPRGASLSGASSFGFEPRHWWCALGSGASSHAEDDVPVLFMPVLSPRGPRHVVAWAGGMRQPPSTAMIRRAGGMCVYGGGKTRDAAATAAGTRRVPLAPCCCTLGGAVLLIGSHRAALR